MRADAPTRTRRSGFAPLCAKSWAVLCLAFSCLNPAADDQPSNRDDLENSGIGSYEPGSPTQQTPADGMSAGQGGTELGDSTSSEGDLPDAGVPLPDAGSDSGAAQ